MKYITVFLLLITVFFGGMTYGTMETNHALDKEEIVEKEETMEMEPFTEESSQTLNTADINENTSFIHEIASLFEEIFLSIYSFFVISCTALLIYFFNYFFI
ncbi:MAG TPA: hypothetical protein VK100_09565 [Pseudogracilibacillus sp.]|nr:hypothetical protein [Pseudogracilibacillus sp.]